MTDSNMKANSTDPPHDRAYALEYKPHTVTSHASRTAEVDGGFIIPHLKPNSRVLDVGCGPGTITSGFCKYVPDGFVTGIDISEEVLELARQSTRSTNDSPLNLKFTRVDILKGILSDDEAERSGAIPSSWVQSFDVIFLSQVLPHLPNCVDVISNLKQLLKPNGILASTQYDTSTMIYTPDPTGRLDKAGENIGRMVAHGSGVSSIYGGRDAPAYHTKAGFSNSQLDISGRTQIYRDAACKWWWESMAQRYAKGSNFRALSKAGNIMTDADCDAIQQALVEFANDPDGMWFATSIQIVAHNS